MSNRFAYVFALLLAALVVGFFVDISHGAVKIPLADIPSYLTGSGTDETLRYIVQEYRLPKALTAIGVGAALALSGLLMQTVFRNPLAGPYVLGLSSGASLGVALLIMASGLLPLAAQTFFRGSWGIILAAALGSFMVLLLILLMAKSVKDSTSLLVIGLMFGSFAGAIVGTLSFYSTAENLQRFTLWALGSLDSVKPESLAILLLASAIGFVVIYSKNRTMDLLLLGPNYAQSMGIHYKKTILAALVLTSILAGITTALVGPIAFVGIAVPHIARLWLQSSAHRYLIPISTLLGAVFMLICDTLSYWPIGGFQLPINAITSLIGAPIVIGFLVRKKHLML